MTSGHWLAVGLFLTGLATQVQSLHAWSEVWSPAFVSGAVLNLGSVIVAAASKQVGRDPTQRQRDDDKQ